jgi:CelD/BcsL family acetyltransferase involved in cellulose biosynthesis
MSVDVVNDVGDFVALAPEWNGAVERAGVAHPFLRHEWLRSWWSCFGAGCRLHVLVVRVGGRIAAIAPLLRDATRIHGVPLRRTRFLHNDHTPRMDVMVAEHPEESYRAIWGALRQTAEPWDLLQLSQIPAESPTHDAFARLAGAEGCALGIRHGGQSPYLPLTRSWPDYLARLSPKFRQNIRNRLSRLTRLGEPALEVLHDPASIRAAREDVWRLEASGWKGAAGTALRSDPAACGFYEQLAERAAHQGWLRLLFLTVNGRRIAVSYGANYQNRLLLFKTGYDPEYADCSPFKLLTYFAIREAYAKGLAEVDFLGDAEPWKLDWTASTRAHDWLFVFSRSLRGRLAHAIKFRCVQRLERWRT